jgi:hypothetical protein
MSDDLDLKPCPLCGRSPQLATSFGEPVVGCVNRSCDLCDTEWFDVDAWNGRPVEDALRARAEAAEAKAATWRTFAVDVHRLLSPSGARGHIDFNARTDRDDLPDLLGAVERLRARAEAAETALASASAEADRLRSAIRVAACALPEWSKGALEYLSPAELVADDVRMALREALLPPVEGA